MVSLSASREMLFDDAYIISLVPTENTRFVAYINGIIPILRQYTQTRRNRELNIEEVKLTVTAINELREFLFVRGQEQKARQKLLRNLKVVELLIDIIRVPFDPDGEYKSFHHCCVKIC